MDTRTGLGGFGFGAGETRGMQVSGRVPIPASGAVAVTLNVTVTEPSGSGYVTVWPSDRAQPLASNLNFIAGQTIPNFVTVGLGSDGAVKLFSQVGTHLVVDVVGYFYAGFNPVTPARVMDTRSGVGGALGADAYEIAAGRSHSCALAVNGSVSCWGSNDRGQLGNSSGQNSSTPVLVPGLPAIRQITAGWDFTCAITDSDSSVWCWGAGDRGQMGDGSTDAIASPSKVPNLTDVSQISAGSQHVCAALFDETAVCWGANSDGQIGDGSINDQSTPISVGSLTDVASVAAGKSHSCAALRNGAVRCWGLNSSGQLGDGTTTDSLSPVDVVTGSDAFVAISAGEEFNCAVLSTKTVKCWGENADYQLGDGSTTDRNEPVSVVGLSEARAVSAGGSHSCVLMMIGIVRCWGANTFGELGDDSTSERVGPVTVSALSGALSVSAGSNHGCIVKAERTLRCWGSNSDGQLGDQTTQNRSTPVAVFGYTTARPPSGSGIVLGPGETRELQIQGNGGLPTEAFGSVALNVTVTEPTVAGYITAWPTGTERPLASNLNFTPRETIPNAVIVGVGSGGKVSLYNSAGSTHLVVDVAGWFDLGFDAVTPTRLMDTRTGLGGIVLGPGASRTLRVTGSGGIPTDGVGGVSLNVTVTEPTAAGYLTVWPAGRTRPLASNLNFVAGQTIPNAVSTGVNASGDIEIYNNSGYSHVVVDVTGWYAKSDTEAPQLQSLSWTPSSVNTSTGSQSITVTARVTDDLSGFDVGPGYSHGSMQIRFRSPSYSQFVDARVSNLVSGSVVDCIVSGSMTLPAFAESGVWTVEYVWLADQVGNMRSLNSSQLSGSGFPRTFTNN
jgi:alpha-tubulin suppressor-like RCC1 family protein